MAVKNIVFDVGNVLLRWSPHDIVVNFFEGEKSPQELTLKLFKSPVWFDLNLGKLTVEETIEIYSQQLGIPKARLEDLMVAVMESLVPLEGSVELLDELHKQGIPLYSITDNVVEIMKFLRNRYDFFDKFSGVVVSGELGILKPSPLIYKHLLDSHLLDPKETVFIDDLEKNVKGAQELGLHGIQFTHADQCRSELRALGVLV